MTGQGEGGSSASGGDYQPGGGGGTGGQGGSGGPQVYKPEPVIGVSLSKCNSFLMSRWFMP